MKHLFPLMTCIIFNQFCYAQLSIRNDNYIFLNNEIIFVNDDINLNEANSTIFLRNEAQLIQGSGTIGNSGIGELSVYQNGNVGAYEYNYWCSPIGVKTNNMTNNPFGISLLNDITGLTTSTSAIISHLPNYNSISSPLTIEPYWIWKYIASDSYWEWIHVGENNTINPGEGFTMKGTLGSSNSQQYDFRGKPNNGTIAIEVQNNQFTLVGNPYPSAIDALSYIHDTENTTNITGTLYFWEQDPNVNSHYLKEYEGGYATYTIDAFGVETYIPPTFSTYDKNGVINGTGLGSSSGKRPRRYIPIGQGFMVEGRRANHFVKAKNSHRVYVKETDSNSEFFKTSTTKKDENTNEEKSFYVVPSDYKRFRLNIDFNNIYTRQLVETFHTRSTDGFDYGLESKINESDILKYDAHWIVNDEPFLAEALPFNNELKIPLAIKLDDNSSIKIRITDIQNFENNKPIYLHDLENETYTNLTIKDFNINLNKGYYKNRFEITFNNESLNTKTHTINNIKVFNNDKTSYLTLLNPNNLNIKTFSLFDVAGKLIIKKDIFSSKSNYTFSTRKYSNGVYILKANFDNNQSITKKIKIINKK